MPNLSVQRDRDAVVRRLRQLAPEATRRWGKMTVHQMLCHVSDQMRVALGDIPSRDMGRWFTGQMARVVAIHTSIPWPRGVPTAPEMQTAKPATWDDDIAACETLIARFGVERPTSAHPAFGTLTAREWGILSAKHLHHHLTQFGV